MSTTAILALPDLPLAMPTSLPAAHGEQSLPLPVPEVGPHADTTQVGTLDTRAMLVPIPSLTESAPPATSSNTPVPPPIPAAVTVLAPALTQPLAALQPPTSASTPEPGSPWAGSGHAPIGASMAPPVPLPKRVPATLAHTQTTPVQPLPPPPVPQEILDARAQAKGQEALDDHVRAFLNRQLLIAAIMTGAISAPLFSITTAHYVGWGLIPLTVLSTITCLLIAVLRLNHLTAAVVHGLPGSFLLLCLATNASGFNLYTSAAAGMGIILTGTLLSIWLDERRSMGR